MNQSCISEKCFHREEVVWIKCFLQIFAKIPFSVMVDYSNSHFIRVSTHQKLKSVNFTWSLTLFLLYQNLLTRMVNYWKLFFKTKPNGCICSDLYGIGRFYLSYHWDVCRGPSRAPFWVLKNAIFSIPPLLICHSGVLQVYGVQMGCLESLHL